ncbi:hypothetical protein ACAF76_018420 [Brevibacillus sp. TJ4]|uniref:hypothetical protein n=1 Tax=Brevibacillus sp. TJ4 TaxID=3234853 RepID=UPI003BA199AD
MSEDLITGLLGKLSERTGREWTLADIMKLAEKMPKDGTQNFDAVMDEVSKMGLDLSDETRERVKDRMNSGKPLTFQELEKMAPKDVKAKSGQVRKPSRASGKSKHLSMAKRIRHMAVRKKKKS